MKKTLQMDNFHDRLRAARENIGKQKDVAKALQITPLTLLKYEKGERSPDSKTLTSLRRFFKININWLLTGEGEMYQDAAPPAAGMEDFSLVPEISPASCGASGRIAESEILDYKAFSVKFLKKFKNPVLTKAIGNSMLPLIKPGDLLLCDRDPEKRLHPDRRHIYVVNDPDESEASALKIKRLSLAGHELFLLPLNIDEEITTIYIKDKNMLDIVLGVIVWMSRNLAK